MRWSDWLQKTPVAFVNGIWRFESDSYRCVIVSVHETRGRLMMAWMPGSGISGFLRMRFRAVTAMTPGSGCHESEPSAPPTISNPAIDTKVRIFSRLKIALLSASFPQRRASASPVPAR